MEPFIRAHQVGSADRDVRTMRYGHSPHFHAVLGTSPNHFDGNDSVFNDTRGSVDIGKEPVQCLQALGKSRFELPPFTRGNDPGQTVDQHDTLVGHLVAVNRKRDAFT